VISVPAIFAELAQQTLHVSILQFYELDLSFYLLHYENSDSFLSPGSTQKENDVAVLDWNARPLQAPLSTARRTLASGWFIRVLLKSYLSTTSFMGMDWKNEGLSGVSSQACG